MRWRNGLTAAVAAGLLAVAGCTSDRAGSAREGHAQVTRFYLSPAIARANVFVEPLDVSIAGTPRFQVIRGAAEDNLRQAGFRPVPARDAAELVAVVGLTRAIRPELPGSRGSGASVGFGAGGGSGYSGVGGGLGISFPLGKRRSGNHDVGVDTMTISLRRRSDSTVIWEGRSVGEVRTDRSGDPADHASFLAHALLFDFPGRSGVTTPFPPRR